MRSTPSEPPAEASATSVDDLERGAAIRQIEKRRRFQLEALVATVVMAVIVASWAISEYGNAHGWPTSGFSQSSGEHHVWNYWIIYPLIAWVLYLGIRAWSLFVNKPISEREIQDEIDRQRRRDAPR